MSSVERKSGWMMLVERIASPLPQSQFSLETPPLNLNFQSIYLHVSNYESCEAISLKIYSFIETMISRGKLRLS